MMFARLQLAQSEICKAQATDYMKQIEGNPERTERMRRNDRQARNCQQMGSNGEGVGKISISGTKTTGKDCYPMSQNLSTS